MGLGNWVVEAENDDARIALCYGKEIESVYLTDDDELHLKFTNGNKLVIWDAGQDCCEHRWLHTDDELGFAVGAVLLSVQSLDGPRADNGGDVKDSAFLRVTTSKGDFTVVCYNEHNGYYGGFSLRARFS